MSELSNNSEKKAIRNEKGQLLPGVVLNPAGKPPGTKHLSTLLWKALLERAKDKDGKESDKTYGDLLIQKLLKDAIQYGKRTDLIFDRIEGQAKAELDVNMSGDRIDHGADVVAIARKVAEELKKKKTG